MHFKLSSRIEILLLAHLDEPSNLLVATVAIDVEQPKSTFIPLGGILI